MTDTNKKREKEYRNAEFILPSDFSEGGRIFDYSQIVFPEKFTKCIHTFNGDGDWYFRDKSPSPSENYKELAKLFGTDAKRIVRPVETHTANAAAVSGEYGGDGVIRESRLADTDSIITDEKGLILCMLQSDCPIVYLFDPVRKVVGLVHSGRKGTEQNIVGKTVRLMTEKYGVDPKNVEAAVSPHICKDCYCVDEDVACRFASFFPENLRQSVVIEKNGKYTLNLAEAICSELTDAGVKDFNISVSDVCTFERNDLFSYRSGDGIKSNLAAIMLEDTDDGDYRTWRQYDYRFNMTEAWPESEYPDTRYRYFKRIGCFVTSFAIMLRHFGIEKEESFEKFNPWIFLERTKKAGFYNSYAEFDPYRISEMYPLEYVGDIPYSREKLAEYMKNGYAVMISVPGIHGLFHYIVPEEITENDVKIIDCGWDYEYLSEFSEVCDIVLFKIKVKD